MPSVINSCPICSIYLGDYGTLVRTALLNFNFTLSPPQPFEDMCGFFECDFFILYEAYYIVVEPASEVFLSNEATFQNALSPYFIKSYAYGDHIQRFQALNYSF
jgi:hypothetical protein